MYRVSADLYDRKLVLVILICSHVILLAHPVIGRYYTDKDKDQFEHDLNNACSFGWELISIEYDKPVQCDDTVLTNQVNSQPSVRFEAANNEKTYTIIMFKWDNYGSDEYEGFTFLEWAAAGIKGDDIKRGAITSSSISYVPPRLIQDKPKTKYELLVIEETMVDSNPFLSIHSRSEFDIWRFVVNNNLNNVSAMFELYVENRETQTL